MATLKKPLVALRIAPNREERLAILDGRKKITIRDGYREGYNVGRPVMLCCQIDPWCVMADITKVRHCLLREVTEDECRAGGFSSREEFLTGMRQFYPEIKWNSAVTVISWDNVRGKLVDDWTELRKMSWVLQK